MYISSGKSRGLFDEIIKPTYDNSLSLVAGYYVTKIRLNFRGSCSKQDKVTYIHKTSVNIQTLYEMGASGSFIDDLTLKNSLFGAVRLTKNADIDKHHYSGYGIGFDRRSSFSFQSGAFGQNIIPFGADMNSSGPIDNKKKSFFNPWLWSYARIR